MTDWLNQRRKAIAAFLQAVAQALNAFVPQYSTQTKEIVAVVLAALGVLAVHQVANAAQKRTRGT